LRDLQWNILWPFGLFYCHLVYCEAIWYILWLFGVFSQFWYIVPRKIWQPWSLCVADHLGSCPHFADNIKLVPESFT
jgi:hypothetical protein